MGRPTLLNDARLHRLMNDPAVRREFPFMVKPPARLEEGCCGKKKSPGQPNFNAIKASIAGLSPEQQKRFLELVGLPSARVIFHANQQVKNQKLG